MNIKNKIFLTFFALVSITSSMDNWLNFILFGFNIRFSVLLMILFSGFTFFEILKNKDFKFPLFMGGLLAFAVLNFIFSFNSVFILRSIGYSIWLFIFLGWVFSVFYWVNRDKTILPFLILIYIFSFLPALILGWLQWVIPTLLLTDNFLWKTQTSLNFFGIPLQRANGWNFEPSYFATYLIVLPPVLYFWMRQSKSFKEKLVRFLFLTFSILVIFLSASRMGWLALLIFTIFIALFEFYNYFKKSGFNKVVKISIFIFLVFIIFGGLIFYKKITIL
ncbi:MAG: hypothetical protein ACP5Q5_10945 [Brevinematia bacterium]